jgi:hypothetical protein
VANGDSVGQRWIRVKIVNLFWDEEVKLIQNFNENCLKKYFEKNLNFKRISQ